MAMKQEHAGTHLIKDRHVRRQVDKHSQDSNSSNSLMKDILFLLLKITVIVVAAILIFTFIYGMYRVDDIAMKPAMQDGDIAVFYRLDKKYVASDTIMLIHNGEKQVRRVIAVAGDVVNITENGLLINGALVQEENIYEETLLYMEGISFPLTVGANQVFVLCDQRSNPTDSRLYGVVDIKNTLGKVMLVIRRRNI